ncbi:hypothetical protein VTK26DRAFT_4827 [Humicola hyalothermophila]
MSAFFPHKNLNLLDPEFPLLLPPPGEGIRTLGLPGVKCKKCLDEGQEVWVTPGLICPICKTPALDESGLAMHPCQPSCHEDDQ